MASNPPGRCCTVGTRHEGEPQGKLIKINNTIEAYVATPPKDSAHKNAGILYIPDIFGIYQNSKLLADDFASRGYTTLVLDLFNGDAYPVNTPGAVGIMDWIQSGSDGKQPHLKEQIDPLIPQGIQALRDLGITNIGAVGYCFGAKFVVRHFKSGIQVGFVAHPSFVEDEELAAITGPFSIAAAEIDDIFPTEKRHKSEDILIKTGLPWQINLFSGVEHGFAVRGDPSVRENRFAKDQAFLQAVAWFDEHLLSASKL